MKHFHIQPAFIRKHGVRVVEFAVLHPVPFVGSSKRWAEHVDRYGQRRRAA